MKRILLISLLAMSAHADVGQVMKLRVDAAKAKRSSIVLQAGAISSKARDQAVLIRTLSEELLWDRTFMSTKNGITHGFRLDDWGKGMRVTSFTEGKVGARALGMGESLEVQGNRARSESWQSHTSDSGDTGVFQTHLTKGTRSETKLLGGLVRWVHESTQARTDGRLDEMRTRYRLALGQTGRERTILKTGYASGHPQQRFAPSQVGLIHVSGR